MKPLLVALFFFYFGIIAAGIRMTDDKKPVHWVYKLKEISTGIVRFREVQPEDEYLMFDVGDTFSESRVEGKAPDREFVETHTWIVIKRIEKK